MEDREDTLVIPETWHRSVHPRRNGLDLPPVKVSKGAIKKAQAHIDAAKDGFDALDPDAGELAKLARRHLAGDPNPAGAAVVALIAELAGEAKVKTFTEAWVAEHGIVFAACAVVELSSTTIVRKAGGSWKGTWLIPFRRKEGDATTAELWTCARRVRSLLASAGETDDAVYEEAVERLAELRDGDRRRLMVSYLVPTRHDWVVEICAEHTGRPRWTPEGDGPRPRIFQMLATADQIAALGPGAEFRWSEATIEVLATLLDGLGPDVLPIFANAFDNSYLESPERKRLLDTIGLIPTDEAFWALLDRQGQKHAGPALMTAMKRFPVRALRLLPAKIQALRTAGDTKAAAALTGLLTWQLMAYPDTVAATEPTLPEELRAVIASAAPSGDRVPDAPAEALPPLLVEPPWTRARKTVKPIVIAGLEVKAESRMAWAEGEREAWAVPATPPYGRRFLSDTDWEEVAAQYRQGNLGSGYSTPHFLAMGPEEVVRPLLAELLEKWEGLGYWDAEDIPWVRSVVGRYGIDALPLATKAAQGNPGSFTKLLLPFLDAGVAAAMAGWLARTKSARSTAKSWFDRHGTDAAVPLIPRALQKPGRARQEAEAALMLIASRQGDRPVIDATRDHYGDKAADAIQALLATDPLDRLPAKMPAEIDWADPVRLPQLILKDTALPASATGHFITMLAMSKPGEIYAGVDVVRDLCDKDSLARFSWALFQDWERADSPADGNWALRQLAWLGDDETVRQLTPVIRKWPGEAGHHKAVAGLEVLAEIGSDVALLHLHGISQKVKFKGLKTKAQEKIAEVATGLGLTAEQLADRLVPDFGLDADGSLTLDYGPRRFTVGFDEQLKPYVQDESGKRLKALPKPGAKDDEAKAPDAYKRFAGLKKDVRTIAADQVSRLETAMVTRRRWAPAEFQSLFVEHPLIWHIARRLVWLADDRAFRLAEDRTLADAEDDPFTIPPNASIGIAHPLDLGEATNTWSEVFADYEILQPFPQLGREVHAFTDEERTQSTLPRFEKISVPVHTVLGLVRRGWERGTPLDAGGERWISKPVSGGLHVVIDLNPGISVGYIEESGGQSLDHIWVNDHPNDYHPSHAWRTFGELDPVTASEVLSDLAWLAASKF